MPEPMYYIQNVNHSGDSLIWWKPDGNGYTKNLDEAWKLPQEQAFAICAARPNEDFAWPCEQVDKCAKRVLDFTLTRPTTFLLEVTRKEKLREIKQYLEAL